MNRWTLCSLKFEMKHFMCVLDGYSIVSRVDQKWSSENDSNQSNMIPMFTCELSLTIQFAPDEEELNSLIAKNGIHDDDEDDDKNKDADMDVEKQDDKNDRKQ